MTKASKRQSTQKIHMYVCMYNQTNKSISCFKIMKDPVHILLSNSYYHMILQIEPNFKLQLKLKTKNKQINKEREIIQNVKQSDWPASVFQWSQSWCDLEST